MKGTSTNAAATLPKNWPKGVTYLTAMDIPPPMSSWKLMPNPPLGPPEPTSTSAAKTTTTTSSNIGKKRAKKENKKTSSDTVPQDGASKVPQFGPSMLPAAPNPLVKITTITESSHPAYGERGLFALKPLAPDSLIILYLGTLHSAETALEASEYDLSLDRDLGLGIDATNCGNEARFVNDYRGIRPDGPNAEFRECQVEVRPGCYERRMGVFVLSAGSATAGKNNKKKTTAAAKKRSKGISKGEEIVVSYGKGFWAVRKQEELFHMLEKVDH